MTGRFRASTVRGAAAAVALTGLLVSSAAGLAYGVFRAADGAAPSAPSKWDSAFDAGLRQAFAAASPNAEAPYDTAFAYFVTAFHDRERPGGASADQPGAPSRNGKDSDAFESFARLAPMVATWLASGRAPVIDDLHGKTLDLRRLVHNGIVNGTDPNAPSYWGRISDLNQRIVEAADIARTLWIVRRLHIFSPAEIAQACAWLRQVNGRKLPDNNWHLFPVLINEVLESLGQPADQAAIDTNFHRFLQFYRGDGWFSDGPASDFDFYNAWAIQYELFWLRQISPGFGGAKVADAMRAFVARYPYLIGPQGIPIMGRSVCYRMAAPAPLIAGAVTGGPRAAPTVDPGLARRSLDAVWRYFVARGAVADGIPTQGYCSTDLRILDNYSGPASCLWALRSLVLAFMAPPRAPLWTAPTRPLPIERGSYHVLIPAIDWIIDGDASDDDIRIVRDARFEASSSRGTASLDGYGPLRRLASAVLWRPFRPANTAAKYDAPVYSSAHPFCGCAGNSPQPQTTTSRTSSR